MRPPAIISIRTIQIWGLGQDERQQKMTPYSPQEKTNRMELKSAGGNEVPRKNFTPTLQSMEGRGTHEEALPR